GILFGVRDGCEPGLRSRIAAHGRQRRRIGASRYGSLWRSETVSTDRRRSFVRGVVRRDRVGRARPCGDVQDGLFIVIPIVVFWRHGHVSYYTGSVTKSNSVSPRRFLTPSCRGTGAVSMHCSFMNTLFALLLSRIVYLPVLSRSN